MKSDDIYNTLIDTYYFTYNTGGILYTAWTGSFY